MHFLFLFMAVKMVYHLSYTLFRQFYKSLTNGNFISSENSLIGIQEIYSLVTRFWAWPGTKSEGIMIFKGGGRSLGLSNLKTRF